MIPCPLCKDNKIKVCEIITSDQIIKEYFNGFNEDVKRFFTDIKSISLNQCSKCRLKFFDPLITGDEIFYENLQKYPWYYQNEKEEYKIAAGFIDENHSVLEIGAGCGHFSKQIPTKNYIGLEFNQTAIDKALKENIKLIKESVEKYSNNHKASYDIICSFQVLEHVENPYTFLQSSIKLLKSGGILILSVPSDNSFVKWSTTSTLNMPPHHVTRWPDFTLNQLEKIFDIKKIILHHELLQKTHISWYRDTLINTLINNKNNSFIKNQISKIIYKIISKKLKPEFYGVGHSVIAIYRKK